MRASVCNALPEGFAGIIIWLCKQAFWNARSDELYDVLSLKELAQLSSSQGNRKFKNAVSKLLPSACRRQRAEKDIQCQQLVYPWIDGPIQSAVSAFVSLYVFFAESKC